MLPTKILKTWFREGFFREDLLYRINTIQIELPPLRDRGNDIIILAEFFLRKYTFKYNKPDLKINQQAHEKLLKYSWPGNIRELQHTIEKAVILSESNILKPEDLYLKQSNYIRYQIITFSTLEEMESQMIQQALEKNNGNFTAAAEQLGITRQTLYNRIKKSRPMISRNLYFNIIFRVLLIVALSFCLGIYLCQKSILALSLLLCILTIIF